MSAEWKERKSRGRELDSILQLHSFKNNYKKKIEKREIGKRTQENSETESAHSSV